MHVSLPWVRHNTFLVSFLFTGIVSSIFHVCNAALSKFILVKQEFKNSLEGQCNQVLDLNLGGAQLALEDYSEALSSEHCTDIGISLGGGQCTIAEVLKHCDK